MHIKTNTYFKTVWIKYFSTSTASIMSKQIRKQLLVIATKYTHTQIRSEVESTSSLHVSDMLIEWNLQANILSPI